jgi:hypothetical protein
MLVSLPDNSPNAMAEAPKNFIYVVVTEDYYGGGEESVRVFKDREAAQIYAECEGEKRGKDIRVLKTEIVEIPDDIKKIPEDVTQ